MNKDDRMSRKGRSSQKAQGGDKAHRIMNY